MIIICYFALFGISVAEASYRSEIWPFLAIVVFGLFVYELSRRHRIATIYMFPVVLSKILFVFSLMFIGLGLFVSELGITAQGIVFAGYYALLSCGFLHVAALTFRRVRPVMADTTIIPDFPLLVFASFWLIFSVNLLAMLYLVQAGLRDGFPLLQGVDRFAYRAQQDVIFNFIITTKPLLVALLGMLRFRLPVGRTARLSIDLVMIAFTILVGLFGEKFASVLVMVGFYLTPYFVLNPGAVRGGPLIALTMVLATFVSGLTYYVYSGYGTLNADQTSERLFGRFTGQGQLWYAALQEPTALATVDSKQLRSMEAAMVSADASETAFARQTGVFYLVARLAPGRVAASVMRQEGLVQFTGATEAFLILVLGHVPMILILLLFGAVGGVIIAYIDNALVVGSVPGVYVAVFIFLPFYSMLNQASFWQVFGQRAALYFAGGIAIDLAYRLFFGARAAPRLRRTIVGPIASRAASATIE